MLNDVTMLLLESSYSVLALPFTSASPATHVFQICKHTWLARMQCCRRYPHGTSACKTAVTVLGANSTEKAIVRVGQCLGPLVRALKQFDSVTDIPSVYDTHSGPRRKKDILVLIAELLDSNIFGTVRGRNHTSFGTMSRRLFLNLDYSSLVDWMKSHLLKKL